MANISLPDPRAVALLSRLPQLIVGNIEADTTQFGPGYIYLDNAAGYDIRIYGDGLHAETLPQLGSLLDTSAGWRCTSRAAARSC